MLVCGFLAFVCTLALGLSVATAALAAWRLSRRSEAAWALDEAPVSIVRPLCGLETFSAETLESSFRLDHPAFELIFCVHRASDPVVPLVRRLMAAYPDVPARLLVGEEARSENPKLDNCLKGWDAATHDWVVLADSNVAMPPDYLRRLLRAWRADSGLVCSMPLGTRPRSLAASVECAFLNGFQARWQYAAEAVGSGFAQGKSMLWNKPFLDRRGGLLALASEAAEDAAATKLVRAAGCRVHLVDAPFPQPLGERHWAEIWKRQVRWARLRRVTFPLLYPLECLCSPVVAALGLAAAAPAFGLSPWIGLAGLAGSYAAEIGLVRTMGWERSGSTLFALLARDLIIPGVWLAGLFGRQVSWHGRTVPVRRASGPATAGAPA
jgi:ceramide glucosyltransferase